MYTYKTLIDALKAGDFADRLGMLYAPDGSVSALNTATARALQVTESFQRTFSPLEDTKVALFSGPGRTEIGGNHTDHQHGHVLAASVELDILACAGENNDTVIRVSSEGYPLIRIDLDDLAPRIEESGTSAALVRGVAAGIAARGYAVRGVDICAVSDIPAGSGLSSSAAFEVLIGNVLNFYCCGSTLDAVELAKIGQYAENVYFGKPCGLMDQMASSVGGAVFIDFQDPAAPAFEHIDSAGVFSGYTLCIVDTRSGHADLTRDYAEITREMGAVAAHFGKKYLREIPEADVMQQIPTLRRSCGDRAVLRAMHYYADDRRAVQEAEALKTCDLPRFFSLVNESGLSSALCLQNIWSAEDPDRQPVSIALEIGRRLLNGEGAIRVHGGGFGGTIQAFVPDTKLVKFRSGVETILGTGTCHMLHIRANGGCAVID